MNKRIVCIFMAFALLLSGCVNQGNDDEQSGLYVYRLGFENTGGRLIRETLEEREGEEPLDIIVDALNSHPQASAVMTKAFPVGTEIIGVDVEKGRAIAYMSEKYALLTPSEKLLTDAAVVLSLSTLDEVSTVDIFCRNVAFETGLTAEEFWVADGLCGEVTRTAKLYLPDSGHSGLSIVSANISESSENGYGAAIFMKLVSLLGGGMENTEVISCRVEAGLCSLDISEEFYGAEPTEAYEGMLLIYSIVNSLCRLPGVDAVSISVEGYPVESYGGFGCVWPLGMNESLVSY